MQRKVVKAAMGTQQLETLEEGQHDAVVLARGLANVHEQIGEPLLLCDCKKGSDGSV